MAGIPVIAIFDIGKTNKKFFLFDEQYKIVLEQTIQFDEVGDEDGDLCEDVFLLSSWVMGTFSAALEMHEFSIKALNFSTYGASFVHVDFNGKVVAPLYNYLKPYPDELRHLFYDRFGGETKISLETASPALGNLNSGMQLLWLKNERRELFEKIQYSLHLPQYISFLITGKFYSDITSIGCHTQLWDFKKGNYHQWVMEELIAQKLPAIMPSFETTEVVYFENRLQVGTGLHDSSAALIPYLSAFSEPFVLISTGTWCISLNPFNDEPLTTDELTKDCLCYLEYKGNPVKASRLFAGYEHEQQTKIIASHFNVPDDFFKEVMFDGSLLGTIDFSQYLDIPVGVNTSFFGSRVVGDFPSFQSAYHQLIADIVLQQKASTNLILGASSVKRIFVDGGFGKNPVYMNLLAAAFPEMEVYAASVSQATSIGAALAIHDRWNRNAIPADMIDLKYYTFRY